MDAIEARRLADDKLVEVQLRAGAEVVITAVEEHDHGWLYHYQFATYLETGEPHHRAFGTSPILVDRRDGTVRLMTEWPGGE